MGPAALRSGLPPPLALAAWGIVAAGAAARVARYLANRSLWGDEGSLAINLVERSAVGLATPLAHAQAAPLGFLWLEKAASLAFGESEYALRLVPLLAGLAALPLFHCVARALLPPRDALVALALFAVSEPLVFYASEVKPYSSDVLVALAIAWPALALIGRGPSRARLAALGAAGALGPWLSLPAVFAVGGCGLAAGAALWRRGGARAAAPIAALSALWLGLFAAEYALLLRGLRGAEILAESWRAYFAPLPLSGEALAWWWRGFLGFFNDPLGLPANELAAPLFVAGAAALLRRAPEAAMALLAPIALALAAALAGLHPFPTSSLHGLSDRYYPFYGRLVLFAVPLALPFVAAGIGWLAGEPGRPGLPAPAAAGALGRGRRLLALAAALALFAAPVRQLAVNLLDPPRIHELRPLMPRIAERFARRDRIFAQQYATGVVAYYARRFGLGPLAGELVLEAPSDLPGLGFALRELGPGDRFWVVTLHHPHWRSEAERDAIAGVLGHLAVRVERLEGEGAEAALWRVRDEWRPSGRAGGAG
jgi:hypothetical protein